MDFVSPVDQLANAQLGVLRTPHSVSSPQEARAAAENFESFFLATILDSMFSGIETDGLLGGGHAEAVFRSLLNQEYGKTIASAGGIGVADQVEREIPKLQEVGE